MNSTAKNKGWQRLGDIVSPAIPRAHTLSVRDDASPKARTARHWGISEVEIERLGEAMHFCSSTRRPFVWIVAGDGIFDIPERQAREHVRGLKSDLVLILRRAGLPAWWIEVIEATGGFHTNIIAPACPGIESLRNGAHGFALKGEEAIQRVTDWPWLVRYLSKERTPQADRKHGDSLGPRLPGSHQLETRQSGDRVRVSKELEAALAGRLKPYARSYAKPKTLSPPQLVAIDQVKAEPPPLAIVEAAGGQLAFALGEPVNLAAEVEKRRRELGLSQEAAAARIGVSRPTFANAALGRYRFSAWVQQRAVEFLKAA